MEQFRSIAAVAALGAVLLSGCGGAGSSEAYCDELDGMDEQLSAIGDGDFGDIGQVREALDDLADAAPEEVADDWQVMQAGLDELFGALEDIGVDADALDSLSNGEMPEGLEMSDLQEIGERFEALEGEMTEAAAAIEEHAEAECDIEL